MPVGAVGRNDPCPCGSGKKYKKCCLGKEALARHTAAAEERWKQLPSAERARIAEEVQRLDDLSNGALDAIQARRYEDADRLCEKLIRDYPELIDGHDRLGMLREAQGRFAEAAEHYAKALAIIEGEPDRHDQQMAGMFRKRRDETRARAKQRS
jgi:uncharacterized protein YecA (UPF0149 family)